MWTPEALLARGDRPTILLKWGSFNEENSESSRDAPWSCLVVLHITSRCDLSVEESSKLS